MADIENGFSDFAEELQHISERITDENVQRKALEAGAKPIVERAKRIMSSHRRTGNLIDDISSEYNDSTKTQDIGWGKKGFYGRFYENGYRPVTGKWSKSKSRRRKLINKRPSGKFIKIEHIKPAYEAEKENVAKAMIETYQNEI